MNIQLYLYVLVLASHGLIFAIGVWIIDHEDEIKDRKRRRMMTRAHELIRKARKLR